MLKYCLLASLVTLSPSRIYSERRKFPSQLEMTPRWLFLSGSAANVAATRRPPLPKLYFYLVQFPRLWCVLWVGHNITIGTGRRCVDFVLWITKSITGFRYGAMKTLSVTATMMRRRVTMVNRRRVEKDVLWVGVQIEVEMMFLLMRIANYSRQLGQKARAAVTVLVEWELCTSLRRVCTQHVRWQMQGFE